MLLEKEGRTTDGEGFVAKILEDLDNSDLAEKERALLHFVEKVNPEPPQSTEQATRPLHAAGLEDDAIYYALTVCALFNFYNRWVDATGVHALSDEAHRQTAMRSAKMGYIRE